MSKIKKLNLTELNKLDKQNDELVTIYLANNTYSLEVYKKFRTTKIQKLLIEVQEVYEVLRREKVSLDDAKNLMLIINGLIIKHFTTLPLQTIDLSTKEGLAKFVNVIEKLIDNGLYEEIMNSFPADQVEKINKLMKDAEKMIGQQLGELMFSAMVQEGLLKEETVVQ